MMRRTVFVAGVIFAVVGCGDGTDKTLRQLGSSKADTSAMASSSGDVRRDSASGVPDSASRRASEMRLRVRDQDALDPSQVRKTPKGKKQKNN
jgi:hypothetical protein